MPLSGADFSFLKNLMAERAGVLLAENQRSIVEARLVPLVRQQGFSLVNPLIRQLQEGTANGLQEATIDALLPKDTAFFRDNHPFNLLRRHILPLLESRRYNTLRLTIWCAGCSSGQEAYSIAMLLYVYFPQLLKWNLNLVASDLSAEAVKQGVEGRYNELEVHRGVPPLMIKQCFRQEGSNYVLHEDIRKVVQFEHFNLVGEWADPFEADIVFLRNVLMYLKPDARQPLLAKMRTILKPDGYLLLGRQETTVDIDTSYRQMATESTVYYQPSGQ